MINIYFKRINSKITTLLHKPLQVTVVLFCLPFLQTLAVTGYSNVGNGSTKFSGTEATTISVTTSSATAFDAIIRDTGWDDFTFECGVATANSTATAGKGGVIFRYTNSSNYYAVTVHWDQWGTGKYIVKLKDSNLSGFNTTGDLGSYANSGSVTALKITAEGNDINVWVNGVLRITVSNSSHSTGDIGFAEYNLWNWESASWAGVSWTELSSCSDPTISGSVTGSRCGTGTVAIQATASAGTIDWFTASSGGSSVGSSSSGVNWTTPSISTTTVYYAEAVDGSCTSAARTAVTATVTANPTVSGSTTGERCNDGTVNIQATASAGSIEWFAASSGGTSIGSSSSGVDWTTPSISVTTIYYAEALNGSCTSASRTAVTATVNEASVGPGGITDELFLWLKADAGTSSIGTSWADQSCNGFDYSTVLGPTKESSDWNYNPAIEILSGGFDAPAGAELGTDWTVIFVSKLLDSDNNGRLIEGHSGNYLLGYHGGYQNGIYWNGSPSEHNSGIATTTGVEYPHIFTYVREDAGSTIDARVDGDALKTFTSTNSGSGIRLDISQGVYSSGDQSLDARVGELIIFSKELSDSEIMKVEAYLATKYGISLNDADGSTGGDYVSTGGTTYWDASTSTGYSSDILVIGRDANTALVQKQAKSEDDSLVVFISTLASDNSSNGGTITNDESFLVIGHNGGKLKSTIAADAEMPETITSRIERVWKIKNTNFDDDFSLEVEWDSLGYFDLSHIKLLVDDDGDFSDATIFDASDGLSFSIGSIIIGGIGTAAIPNGSTKYVTLASGNALTSLPVELLYFKAEQFNNLVFLSWETITEINNDYFIIERSIDGINWTEISIIQGAGNSAASISYSTIDYEGCSGNCYYRLTQVDFNNKREIYKAVIVSAETEGGFSINVNPNPLRNTGKVNYELPHDGVYYFKVYTSSGKIVHEAKIAGVKGRDVFTFNSSRLSSGSYFFLLQNLEGISVQQQVIKE